MKSWIASFYKQRWVLSQVVLGIILISSAWLCLLQPQLDQWKQIKLARTNLEASLDSTQQLTARVDSLRKQLRVLQSFHADLLSHPTATPGVDSIRRTAERSHIEVLDMVEGVQAPNGFASANKFDLQGSCSQLTQWIAQLDSFAPALQVAEMHWSAVTGKAEQCRISGLVLAQGAASKPSQTSELSQWLARANRPMGANVSANAFANIFEGPVVHAPIVVKNAHAPVVVSKPKSAPSLQIVGLVANRLATVNTAKGDRQLLRIGDQIEGWTVLSISSDEVVLENQGDKKSYRTR